MSTMAKMSNAQNDRARLNRMMRCARRKTAIGIGAMLTALASAASAVDLEVGGIELNTTPAQTAVLRTDLTLPNEQVLMWPYVLDATGEPPEVSFDFNGTVLTALDDLVADGSVQALTLIIDGLQQQSGTLTVTVAATDAGTDSLFLIQSAVQAAANTANVPLGAPVFVVLAAALGAVGVRQRARS